MILQLQLWGWLINHNFTIDRKLGDLRRGFPIGFPSIQSLQTMKRERVGFLFVTMMWNYLCYTLDPLDFYLKLYRHTHLAVDFHFHSSSLTLSTNQVGPV